MREGSPPYAAIDRPVQARHASADAIGLVLGEVRNRSLRVVLVLMLLPREAFPYRCSHGHCILRQYSTRSYGAHGADDTSHGAWLLLIALGGEHALAFDARLPSHET